MTAPEPHPGPGSSPPPASRVVVVSRAGCHLCERALDIVRLTVGEESITVLDVDGDLGAFAPHRAQWSDLVPVILVDGAVHDVVRVDPVRLLAALEAR